MKIEDRNVVSYSVSTPIEFSPAGAASLEGWLEEVLNQYWVRVKGMLLRLVDDPDQAEDLALEVFLKLYRQVQKDPSVDNLGGWIYRVSMHLGLNALRSGQRRSRYERSAGVQQMEARAASNPAQVVELHERQYQVRRILVDMKPQAASLLFLRSAGFSYAELSQTLQIPVSSIGTLLNRAEKEFEKRYSRQFGEEDGYA